MRTTMHNDENITAAIERLNNKLENVALMLDYKPDFLTLNAVAEMLNCTPKTVRRWVDQGHLGCYRIPGSKRTTILFKREQLEDDLQNFRTN